MKTLTYGESDIILDASTCTNHGKTAFGAGSTDTESSAYLLTAKFQLPSALKSSYPNYLIKSITVAVNFNKGGSGLYKDDFRAFITTNSTGTARTSFSTIWSTDNFGYQSAISVQSGIGLQNTDNSVEYITFTLSDNTKFSAGTDYYFKISRVYDADKKASYRLFSSGYIYQVVLYKKCTAPTSITIKQKDDIKYLNNTSDTVYVSWSGATCDTALTGLSIQDYTLSYTDADGPKTLTSTSPATVSLNTSGMSGGTISFKIRTNCSQTIFNSDYSECDNSIKINTIPDPPTIKNSSGISTDTVWTSNEGKKVITITALPGSDSDDQSLSVYYSILPDGKKIKINSNKSVTLDVKNGFTYKKNITHIYFYTYDTLSYSEAAEINIKYQNLTVTSFTYDDSSTIINYGTEEPYNTYMWAMVPSISASSDMDDAPPVSKYIFYKRTLSNNEWGNWSEFGRYNTLDSVAITCDDSGIKRGGIYQYGVQISDGYSYSDTVGCTYSSEDYCIEYPSGPTLTETIAYAIDGTIVESTNNIKTFYQTVSFGYTHEDNVLYYRYGYTGSTSSNTNTFSTITNYTAGYLENTTKTDSILLELPENLICGYYYKISIQLFFYDPITKAILADAVSTIETIVHKVPQCTDGNFTPSDWVVCPPQIMESESKEESINLTVGSLNENINYIKSWSVDLGINHTNNAYYKNITEWEENGTTGQYKNTFIFSKDETDNWFGASCDSTTPLKAWLNVITKFGNKYTQEMKMKNEFTLDFTYYFTLASAASAGEVDYLISPSLETTVGISTYSQFEENALFSFPTDKNGNKNVLTLYSYNHNNYIAQFQYCLKENSTFDNDSDTYINLGESFTISTEETTPSYGKIAVAIDLSLPYSEESESSIGSTLKFPTFTSNYYARIRLHVEVADSLNNNNNNKNTYINYYFGTSEEKQIYGSNSAKDNDKYISTFITRSFAAPVINKASFSYDGQNEEIAISINSTYYNTIVSGNIENYNSESFLELQYSDSPSFDDSYTPIELTSPFKNNNLSYKVPFSKDDLGSYKYVRLHYFVQSDSTKLSREANSITYVIQNDIPTVSYRKNRVGINYSFGTTDSSDGTYSDGVMVINSSGSKNKIYFNDLANARLMYINLATGELNNFKGVSGIALIDCGTWDSYPDTSADIDGGTSWEETE